MKIINSKKENKGRYEVCLKISALEFNKAIDTVFRKNSRRFSVPGFCKGKVQRRLVEKYYGEDIFHEDTLNLLLSFEIIDFLESELDIEIIKGDDVMQVQNQNIEENGDVELKLNFDTMPEVNLSGNYKGLEYNVKPPSNITGEDVRKRVNKFVESKSKLVDVTEARGVRDNDVISGTCVVRVGNKEDSPKNFKLKVEPGKPVNIFGFEVPGFHGKVVGKKLGDEVEISVPIPEGLGNIAPGFSDQDMKFVININKIQTVNLENYNNDFVGKASNGKFSTTEEFDNNFKIILEREERRRFSDEKFEQIKSNLSNMVKEGDVPEVLIEQAMRGRLSELEEIFKMQGGTLEAFYKQTGSDEQKLRSQLRPEVLSELRYTLALRAIKKIESIVVTNEELEKEKNAIAEEDGIDKEKISDEYVENMLALQKAYEIVSLNAVNVYKA
ncbi:MAG: trigger factor [Candidatus Improbicoccus pseudotrichonymphae]|uniref:Trigger factor n=1 Tax=Candidatus Improbicoccus pseudotrichonymphae TaxID=3033792 RepID=A0AA48KY82_9FIRM|nr:MAG: trigger factor [Candidatus Improbicoccus pseudotrichonymphae]